MRKIHINKLETIHPPSRHEHPRLLLNPSTRPTTNPHRSPQPSLRHSRPQMGIGTNFGSHVQEVRLRRENGSFNGDHSGLHQHLGPDCGDYFDRAGEFCYGAVYEYVCGDFFLYFAGGSTTGTVQGVWEE